MPVAENDVPGSRVGGLRAIPRGIWALGVVSLFMDLSSEMIHSLLPVFLVSVLGASVLSVGVIEGVAEATASITKVFSETLSDYLDRRKFLTGLGYALAAATKPIFPLATSLSWVLAARFVDRIGKGIREAPRDALMGDLAPAAMRGACYGLRQSLDTVGAVAGPLVAAALMAVTLHDFRLVFWVAVIPAFLAVGILLLAVKEPLVRQPAPGTRAPIQVAEIRALPPVYWSVVGVGTILSLARFSEAFLLLRAADRGVSVSLVPMIFVIMNIAYAVSAYPAGRLSDQRPGDCGGRRSACSTWRAAWRRCWRVSWPVGSGPDTGRRHRSTPAPGSRRRRWSACWRSMSCSRDRPPPTRASLGRRAAGRALVPATITSAC